MAEEEEERARRAKRLPSLVPDDERLDAATQDFLERSVERFENLASGVGEEAAL